MKKIIFTAAAVIAFFSISAQTTYTESWPNGTKKVEGLTIGDAKAASTGTKAEQSRKMDGVVKDGKWTTWFENGTVHSEEYYNKGAMTGVWKAVYENGQTESEINFETGKAVYYTKNGVKSSEGGIANGMLHTGKWTGYYENGNKNYEGSYNVNGQKDGVWTWFDEKGNATTQQTYSNGVLSNTKDLNKK